MIVTTDQYHSALEVLSEELNAEKERVKTIDRDFQGSKAYFFLILLSARYNFRSIKIEITFLVSSFYFEKFDLDTSRYFSDAFSFSNVEKSDWILGLNIIRKNSINLIYFLRWSFPLMISL